MKTLHAISFLLALGWLTPACGSSADDYCEAFCKCANCSVKQEEKCYIDYEASVEVAEVYGCDEDLAALEDCELRKYRCEGGHFHVGNECRPERDRYNACRDDASALH